MKCTQCGEREAIVHLTQMAEDEVTTLHLCERCAAEKGVESGGMLSKNPLGTFLAAMGEGMKDTVPVGDIARPFVCPRCGASLQDFRESGRLGCPDCYRALGEPLRELLRRLHGSARHVGRWYAAPGATPGTGEERARVADLREQLRIAVETENFERAAELRDLLRNEE